MPALPPLPRLPDIGQLITSLLDAPPAPPIAPQPTPAATTSDTVPVDLAALERNITRAPDPLNDSIVNTLSTEVDNSPVDPDEVRESVRAASEKAGWKRCRHCDQPVHDAELVMDDSGQQPIYLHRLCVTDFTARVQRITRGAAARQELPPVHPQAGTSAPGCVPVRVLASEPHPVQLHHATPDSVTFPYWFVVGPTRRLHIGWGEVVRQTDRTFPEDWDWSASRHVNLDSLTSATIVDGYLSVDPPEAGGDLTVWTQACIALMEAKLVIENGPFNTCVPAFGLLRFRCREFPGTPSPGHADLCMPRVHLLPASSTPIRFDTPPHRRPQTPDLPFDLPLTWGTGNLTLHLLKVQALGALDLSRPPTALGVAATPPSVELVEKRLLYELQMARTLKRRIPSRGE